MMMNTHNEPRKPLLVWSNSWLIDQTKDFGVVIDMNSFMSDRKVEANSLMSFCHDLNEKMTTKSSQESRRWRHLLIRLLLTKSLDFLVNPRREYCLTLTCPSLWRSWGCDFNPEFLQNVSCFSCCPAKTTNDLSFPLKSWLSEWASQWVWSTCESMSQEVWVYTDDDHHLEFGLKTNLSAGGGLSNHKLWFLSSHSMSATMCRQKQDEQDEKKEETTGASKAETSTGAAPSHQVKQNNIRDELLPFPCKSWQDSSVWHWASGFRMRMSTLYFSRLKYNPWFAQKDLQARK